MPPPCLAQWGMYVEAKGYQEGLWLVLTAGPGKGTWSQFSCQDWLRLWANSWKKACDWLKMENPRMLTRSSTRLSILWSENSWKDPAVRHRTELGREEVGGLR